MDGSFFRGSRRRSERAGLGVHEIVDHVENMDGFKLLPGAEPRQMRSRGAVVGKRRDHRDRFPIPHPAAAGPKCHTHTALLPRRAPRRAHIDTRRPARFLFPPRPVRPIRRSAAARPPRSPPQAPAPANAVPESWPHLPPADCFCGARPGDQLCRRHAESLCKLFDGV